MVPTLVSDIYSLINDTQELMIRTEMPRSRTVQFSRSFVLSCVRLWNGLHESVFAGEGVGAFNPLSSEICFASNFDI